MVRSWRILLCSALAALVAAGCGSDDKPKTVPVTGTVTYKGQPLTSGMITFLPTGGTTNAEANVRPATDMLESDGTYSLTTFAPGDGVRPGEYLVTIVSYEVPPSPEGGGIWAIPQKYGNPQTSGLKASIPAESDGEVLDFELEGDMVKPKKTAPGLPTPPTK